MITRIIIIIIIMIIIIIPCYEIMWKYMDKIHHLLT